MAGKKGKSGRKPNSDGKKMRAVNLYIPMYEYDMAHINSKQAKLQWVPEDWFRQFKNIHGSRWQEKVRSAIRHMATDYEERNMWACKCQGRLNKFHRMTEGECFRCGFKPGEISRYKTVQNARIHSREEPSQKPLSLCPACNEPYSLKLDEHGRKVMICKVCK